MLSVSRFFLFPLQIPTGGLPAHTLGVARVGSQNPCPIHPWNPLESHLGDGQGQVTKNLEGRGAIPTGLALETTFQLAHKQIWTEAEGQSRESPLDA